LIVQAANQRFDLKGDRIVLTQRSITFIASARISRRIFFTKQFSSLVQNGEERAGSVFLAA